MTAAEFVKKWTASTGTEHATSHEHFIDLCRLLSEQTPKEADPSGDFYAFEKGAKTSNGDGKSQAQLEEENSAAIEELD